MKKNILTFLLILTALNLSSQEFNPDDIEVGFVEKLGETIPLDLQFLNENNDTVTLRELIDKPTVLSFVYFDCPGLCSPLMDGISDVVSNLDMKLGEDYQLITISFNTTDTPEKARTKKENFVQQIKGEDRKHWIYLTGWQENITAITDALGFRYKPQGVDFAHPSGIMLISPSGKITRYLYGLTFLPFDLKMAIIESGKEISRPTINKVLEYCFSYDPASRTYTLQITRIVGSFIIFFAVVIFIYLIIRGRRKNVKK
ncbi:MAG: SCO family protein [Bacteroidales bacterium]|nr:SCO family protein [Bacteroidales bacterium]